MMDWANEEYVRLYVRETADDLELSWEAIALWRAMLCKFDRSGVIPVKNGWPSVARMVHMPVEVVERAGPELVADGRVRATRHGFVSPNFTEAQTASKSDKLRQRESRDRRREIALVKPNETVAENDSVSHAVTRGHTPVTKRDEKSRDVTLPLLPLLPLPPDSAAEAPLAPKSAAAPLPVLDPEVPKKARTRKPKAATENQAPTPEPSDHARLRTLWFDFWQRKTGLAPEWNGRHGKALNALLAAHGGTEVERRIGLLEASATQFFQSWDFLQFASSSERLVAESTARNSRGNYDHTEGGRFGRGRIPTDAEYEIAANDDPFGERGPAIIGGKLVVSQ